MSDIAGLDDLSPTFPARSSIQWKQSVPDDCQLVMLRLEDLELPVFAGFRDGAKWRYANASEVKVKVLGWMDLEEAAAKLDLN